MLNLMWYQFKVTSRPSKPNRCEINLWVAPGWSKEVVRLLRDEKNLNCDMHGSGTVRIVRPDDVCAFLRMMEPSAALEIAITRYEAACREEATRWGKWRGPRPAAMQEEQEAAVRQILALLPSQPE